MRNIYIAYSITNAQKTTDAIFELVYWLRKRKYKVTTPTLILIPDTLAENAVNAIINADIVIADLSNYSHGVGFELGYAYALKKKIITVANARSANTISLFMNGLFPRTIYYTDANNLIENVSKIKLINGKNN